MNMGLFSDIGNTLKTKINTAVEKQKEKAKEEQQFKQEYEAKLKADRRKAQLANTPKIARMEAAQKLKQKKKNIEQGPFSGGSGLFGASPGKTGDLGFGGMGNMGEIVPAFGSMGTEKKPHSKKTAHKKHRK